MVLAAPNRWERGRAVRRIRDTGQARVYARQLAGIAPPSARRRIAGIWQRRYSRRQRINAIAAVGSLGQTTRDVIKPLFAAMGGNDKLIQRAAIAALADLWRIDDLWLLIDENPLNRQQAARSLVHRQDPRTIGPLLVLLPDEADLYVRTSIVQALGRLNAHHAIEDLLKLLKDPEIVVRRAAVEALGAIAASLSPDDPHSQEVVGPMLDVLRKGSWAERQVAAEALGHLGDTERAIKPLLAALDDRDRQVREAAAGALGMLGDARAFEPLCALTTDEYYPAAQAAVRALGHLGDTRAVPLLLDTLRDNPDLCLTSAYALGRLEDGRAVEPLISVLQSDRHLYAVREAAAVALREIGTERALAALDQPAWHDILRANDG
jgi:HEAT repeat protein